EVPLGALALRGLGKRNVPDDPRVDVLGDPLDRPALAGRVPPLEDDDHAGAGVLDPLAHLDELFLEQEQLALVGLPLQARLAAGALVHKLVDWLLRGHVPAMTS